MLEGNQVTTECQSVLAEVRRLHLNLPKIKDTKVLLAINNMIEAANLVAEHEILRQEKK